MTPINLTAVVALILSVVVFPPYIRWLKHKQIEQYIREEGPKSHAAKAKTPTMGGLCFMLVSALVAVAYILLVKETAIVPVSDHATAIGALGGNPLTQVPAQREPALAVIVVGIICGLVGFADDFGKITSRSNRGLSANLRLLIEFGLGLVLAGVLYLVQAAPTSLVGFGADIALNGTWQLIYLVLIVPFLVAATTNAINLHDGMDGLAGGTSVLTFSVLFFMLLVLGKPYMAAICASMVGAVTGFLVYNRFPAQVFMGDTGSLYIGGIMAAIVAASGLVLWFIPLAIVYIAETLSVMAQVVYFKLTKEYAPPQPMPPAALVWTKLTKRLPGEGKRLFRMAPLHHHFEAIGAEKGEPEWKVVAYFWTVQFLLCAVTWMVFSQVQPLANRFTG